ncbi:MAG TPA: serine/threonine-protein kinase [Polyangiaceae bacterium]|jgi:serine/threonine-protein kinase|nr:serine/threonine-protein kinase [Polyangiaceae bacterium]
MAIQPVRSGSVVARRYRATRRIACGAMGEVWEGVHVELGTRVAIKVLRKEAFDCREMVMRFAREAFLLARIQSEHVVRVIDYVERGKHGPVLVMELLEGPTFADIVHRERVPIDEAIDVAIDVLRGLQAMHAAHVIHRDVKPGNIVLRQTSDGRRRAVLIDLGVGRLVEHEEADGSIEVEVEELTTSDRVVGTLEYMAPEQILDCQNADASVDVYAVGAFLFRAIAGVHPFGDKRGVELIREKIHRPVPPLRTGRRDAIARRFEAIVQRAIAFKAKDRYPTADELVADLERLRRDMRAQVSPVELAPRHLRPVVPPPLPTMRVRARKRKVAIFAAAACAALFAACTSAYGGAHADVPASTKSAATDDGAEICR